MSCWYPIYGHPAGPGAAPWYCVEAASVYPMRGAPARQEPWFELLDGFAYPGPGHPEGPSPEPWYRVFGNFVYPTAGHPEGPSSTPWYQIR